MKKLVVITIALCMILGAFSMNNVSNVEAASAKYEYISFYNNTTRKYAKEIKNGKFYFRYRNSKMQVKKGKNGKYKTIPAKFTGANGIAVNDGNVIFIENENGVSTLKMFTFSNGKVKSLNKLPKSACKKTKYNKKYESCHITGAYGSYIFFCSYNSSIAHEGSVMYSYNLKNNKYKKAGLTGQAEEETSGKFFVAAERWRTDDRTLAYNLYKFSNNGTVKKIKNITQNSFEVKIYDGSIYWIDCDKRNNPESTSVLHSMKLNGTDEKILFTETDEFTIDRITSIENGIIVIEDINHENSYKYNINTGEISK